MGRMAARKSNSNAQESNNNIAVNSKKVLPLKEENHYYSKIKKAKKTDRQTELLLEMFDIKNPDIQYESLRMWLNDEFFDGDLTDKFYQLFPTIKTIQDFHGKEFKAYVEYVDDSKGIYAYLRVTDVEPI